MKKKYFLIIAAFTALFACNFEDPQTVKVRSQEHEVLNEEQLSQLNREVLTAIKNKDWQAFSEFIHPERGVCFSPYAYFQQIEVVCCSPEKFLESVDDQETFIWGEYDAIGGPIQKTISEYFDEFVYPIDYLSKAEVIVNDFKGSGNSINNLTTAFPNLDFVENYFPGENEEYGGLDWRVLRMVFEVYEGKYYLVALINDQWTS